MSEKLSETIDRSNHQFTSEIRARLRVLSAFDDQALEWLVMEHYQFSCANPGLLQVAAATTRPFADKGVSRELQRNAEEESGHAQMYKDAMLAVGTDVDARIEFTPTSAFLASMRMLTTGSPSRVLGTLYATETAAIFEHETLLDICHEICARRSVPWHGSAIKAFHDLHLSGGVEQSHKDGLGIFVDADDGEPSSGRGEPIDKDEVMGGAFEAIHSMQVWWRALLDRVSPGAPALASARSR